MKLTKLRRPLRRVVPAGRGRPAIVVTLQPDGSLSVREKGKHHERVYDVSALLSPPEWSTLSVIRRAQQARMQPTLLDVLARPVSPPKRQRKAVETSA